MKPTLPDSILRLALLVLLNEWAGAGGNLNLFGRGLRRALTFGFRVRPLSACVWAGGGLPFGALKTRLMRV